MRAVRSSRRSGRLAALACAAAVFAVVASGGSAVASVPGEIVSFDQRYVAGSVHVGPVVDEAVGPLDCAHNLPTLPSPADGTVGGACFAGLTAFAGLDFVLSATDDLFAPAPVSMFAGFDADHDGCVGCVPGADPSWETDSGTIGGIIDGPTLAVFVRALALGDDNGVHTAAVGNLHLTIFAPGSSPCTKTTQGLDRGERDCGEPFESTLPYPYPCLGVCE